MTTLGWTRRTADGIAISGPARVHAIYFTPSTAADTVTIHNGQDSGGRTFHTLASSTITTTSMLLPPDGLLFDNGLYLNFSASTGDCTIIYETL